MVDQSSRRDPKKGGGKEHMSTTREDEVGGEGRSIRRGVIVMTKMGVRHFTDWKDLETDLELKLLKPQWDRMWTVRVVRASQVGDLVV